MKDLKGSLLVHFNLWISIAIGACYEITGSITEELTASGKSVVAANAAAIFKKKKPTCEPFENFIFVIDCCDQTSFSQHSDRNGKKRSADNVGFLFRSWN